MVEPSVTKRDMETVVNAFQRGEGHLRIVLKEVIEIFDEGTYTLNELRTLKGNAVFKDIPAVYVSEAEYQRFTPEYREKRRMQKVGDKYELIPRRIMKYDRYLIPLFYSALVCRGVTDRDVIKIVTEQIFHDNGWFQDSITQKHGLPSLYGAPESAKTVATQLFNNYIQQKVKYVDQEMDT